MNKIRMPTLIIYGDHDPSIPLDEAKKDMILLKI
jgi:pimeloyl-ACP methyl ester carboxylesterase